MARRVKRRTHTGAKAGQAPESKSIELAPKSLVIRIGAGEVGPSVSQLAKDVRKVMEPGTASRLKERKGNKLRDYTTMSGPLGVTHMILFSKSETGNTNMRIAITPHGPTLHFRVDNYSLCKDILQAMRHPRNDKNAYVNPPLLVMNNFITSKQGQNAQPDDPTKPAVSKQLEQLCTTVFQSLFPPLKPQQTPLTSIKRVLLLNREPPGARNPDQPGATPDDHSNGPATYALTFRHYAITTRPVGLSRAVKRLRTAEKRPSNVTTGGDPSSIKPKKGRSLPNLGNLEDISEWLLNSGDPSAMGYTSASESEADTDAEVEVNLTEKKTLGKRGREREAAAAAAAANGEQPETSAANEPSASTTKSRVERRAIKLVELGPRMRLRLIKIEEGLCEGRIMWHEFVHKTAAEVKMQEKAWQERTKEKEARRQVQKNNVERKKQEKLARKTAGKAAAKEENGADDDDDDDYSDIGDLDDDDLDELKGWKTDDDEDKDVDEVSADED